MSTPRDAYRAAVEGDWNIVHDFYTKEPSSLLNASGDTILHVLALNHHANIIRKLLDLLYPPHDGLLVKNSKGNTALHEAVKVGSLGIVEAMVHKEKRLVSSRNLLGETPLFWAAMFGKKDILCFLLEINSNNNILVRDDFSTILHAAVKGEFYGMALEIIASCPSLALARNTSGITALRMIAQSPASFRSGTIYTCKNIGTLPFIPLEMLAIVIYICLPSYASLIKHSRNTKEMMIDNVPISGFSRFIRWCSWLRRVDNEKLKHNRVQELMEQLIAIQISTNMSFEESDIKVPLFLATKHGILEVVKKILEGFPEAIELVDENGKNILHLAVEHRREEVFEFLRSKKFAIDRMVAEVDNEGNTPLHLAAKLGKQPTYVHGPYQQMPWEVFWFKQVQKASLPHLLALPNHEGHTPMELFSLTHQNLQGSAEEWIKDMANTIMVISTLIAAINFQAVFTVPGGFDQNNGIPVLLENVRFKPFLIILSFALFFSIICLGAALSAHLSRFHHEDYYLALPFKIFVCGTAFYMSTLCTFLAFALALELELDLKPKSILFVIGWMFGLACVLLTTLLYIDILYPIIRITLRAFVISLTYRSQRS